MYLVGEYGRSFPLHLRGTVTIALSQVSSLIGTPDNVLFIANHFLLTFAKTTGFTSGPRWRCSSNNKERKLDRTTFPTLMQWQNGERIERITKAQ